MLYQKWRPQTFDEVVGQNHVVRTLRNAVQGGRIVHAYLFAGPRGTGKTTCARLLAKAVNCQAPVERRPCNECETCRAFNEGRLLDLIEIDAASHTGVDDVRDLQEKIGFRPAQGRYKVYIVDEVHMLSKAAFNALLKTLEEPPEHVIFVLATTEPHRLPATIVSRCQQHAFGLISLEAIEEHVAHVADVEGIEAEPEALALIARHADGALRDALSLLEQVSGAANMVTPELVRQVLGVVPEDGLMDVLEAVAAEDVGQVLTALSTLLAMGAAPSVAADQLTEKLRDALAEASGVEMEGVSPRLKALAREAGIEKILSWLSILVEGNIDDRTGLEMALSQAALGPIGRGAAPRQPTTKERPAETAGEDAKASQQPAEEEQEDDAGTATADAPTAEVELSIPRNLGALQEHWSEVLSTVRRIGNKKVEALLRSCEPVAVDDEQVTIAAAYEFHRKRLARDKTRRSIERALVSLIGAPVAVQVTLTKEKEKESQPQATGWISSVGDLPPALAGDPLVRMAMEELGAVVREVA